MQWLTQSRLVRVLLSASMLSLSCPLSAIVQAPPASAETTQLAPVQAPSAQADTAQTVPPQSTDIEGSLDQAREAIKSGDYDRAIEILKTAIAQARSRLSELREAYLLLIKTHVILGNYLKSQQQGRQSSLLTYDKAKTLIAECLRIKELRHTRPEPESEYPAEMIGFFSEVRGKIFGSFSVTRLVPPDATVLLDADTLRSAHGQGVVGDVDLATGPHLVVIRRAGFNDRTDEITISPGATLAQGYELQKRRGGMWYATRGVAGLGLVGGLIAALAGKGSKGGTTDGVLPPAPDPPSR